MTDLEAAAVGNTLIVLLDCVRRGTRHAHICAAIKGDERDVAGSIPRGVHGRVVDAKRAPPTLAVLAHWHRARREHYLRLLALPCLALAADCV